MRDELSASVTNLVNMALLIPLNKNDKGGIRPISIPSVFRKLSASMCILEFATRITEYVGASQHGAGMSSGAAIMAERIDLLIDLDPSRLFIQVDIENAFSSASRQSTLAALRDCAPELAMSQQSWLCAPAQAVMTDPHGTRVILTTTNGIPQGDPLSSLAFARLLRSTAKTFLREWQQHIAAGQAVRTESAGADVDMPQAAGAALSLLQTAGAEPHGSLSQHTVLDDPYSASAAPMLSQTASAAMASGPNEAVHMRMCACPGIDILAYADDIILVLHPHIATDAWDLWKRTLARHTLKVQADKTVVYHPEGQGPLDGDLLAVFASQPKRTGLQSGEEDGQAIPFGTPELVAEYLQAHAQVMEGRLRALTTLQETLDVHNAQHCRCHWLGWARQIDGQVLHTLSEILDLPALGPNQIEALQIPVSCGGLGFHSLAWEACKHHVSHVLSVRAKYGNLAAALQHVRGQFPFPQAASADSRQEPFQAASAAHDLPRPVQPAGAEFQHAANVASDEAWPWGFQQAALLFEELSESSVSQVLKKSDRELMMDGCNQATPSLTAALYQPTKRASHLIPHVPNEDHRTHTLAALSRSALLWFHFPGQFVDDATVRTFFRFFLQLPVFITDHRCRCQTRVRGLTCGHPGDVEGRHAQSCCAGPIQARHVRLRDESLFNGRALHTWLDGM
eukprot:6492649-Amphidinium_carterae.6